MGMYYREGGMVMTANKKNGYFPDRGSIENCLRASPEPGPFLRCPVSTPLNSHRPLRQRIPESLTFVSLDFSKVKSFPKGQPHKGPRGFRVNLNKNIRTENLTRRKNFDYYYVDRAFQNRLARHSNSNWLKSLCSQPVPEIFYKYRRHGEMLDEPLHVARSHSTPGERSLHEAWDLNSRHGTRYHSAYTSSSKFGTPSQASNSPQLTIISRSCTHANIINTPRVTQESREESLPLPISPNLPDSVGEEDEIETQPTPQPTPRATPIKREPISEIRLPTGYSPLIDESIYEHFERKETKLPDINEKRAYSTSPTKNRRNVVDENRNRNVVDENRNPNDIGQIGDRNGSPVMRKSRRTYRRQPPSSLNEISESIYNL